MIPERPASPGIAIIGAGFAGSTVAERLASAGQQVLVIDQRPHIGGMFFCLIHDGNEWSSGNGQCV